MLATIASLTSSLSLHTPNSLIYTSNANPSSFRCRSLTLTPTSDTNNDEEEPRIKMPTAPWMTGPLLLPQSEILHLSTPTPNPKRKKNKNGTFRDPDRFLTEKVPGRMGKKAAKEIAENIEKLHKESDSEQDQPISGQIGSGIFSEQLVGIRVLNLERERRRLPWVSEDREMVFRRTKKEKAPTAAELSLDKELLWRLRGEAGKMRNWVKVNKAGVVQGVVDQVHSVWAKNELAMLRIGLPLCRNMDRAMEIVELKTGGLVVWSKKDMLVAYRGLTYQKPKTLKNASRQKKPLNNSVSSVGGQDKEDFEMMPNGILGEAGEFQINRSLCEREGDRMLEGLGPRFVDWWYWKPLPVDGDSLPEIVPGFMTPFRLRPPKVRPKLNDYELTYLRKFAVSLPTHFVLGRNRGLQGLAASILKLWKRCILAKIAIKPGVPNTSNELMASELKHLTGGVLILRNKFIIILYRGKDFVPGDVASLVVDRETEIRQWQLFEEETRDKSTRVLSLDEEASVSTSLTGTLSEFDDIKEICNLSQASDTEADVQFLVEKDRLQKLLKSKRFKLANLKRRIGQTSKALSKVNSVWNPSEEKPDHELMTIEERQCLKKIGLKMTHVLVLGRRGVFDGVIEGIHQHWKHREVVKVISKQRNYSDVILTTTMLEREAGGNLVSVDKQKEGYSIIMYRGKNYKRPIKLGNNLLDKRKALQRSIDMQRLGSLRFIAYQREQEILELKLALEDLERRRGSKNHSN